MVLPSAHVFNSLAQRHALERFLGPFLTFELVLLLEVR